MEESTFRLEYVDNKITLEQLDVGVQLTNEQCIRMSQFYDTKLLDKEKTYYYTIEEMLRIKHDETTLKDVKSRRICVNSYQENNEVGCGSLFHLIVGRDDNNMLIVYQRSMSNEFFVSDLVFYSYLASKYGCSLSVNIGSFHFIV